MKKNTLISLLILALITFTMSCKTKKVVVSQPSKVTEVAVATNKTAENLRLLKSKDFSYSTLSLKAKADLDIDGNQNGVNMNIKIKKDEKIWISITAIAGIEVARVLITPDSLLVLSRLQGTALKKPFSYIYKFANKQITFKMLQSVLTGNTITELMNEPADLQLNTNEFSLKGNKETLAYTVLFNTLLKPAQVNLSDVKAGQALKVEYANYQQAASILFPSVVKVNSVSGKKKINVVFDFSNIERNVQFDFPFTVPKRFEIIN